MPEIPEEKILEIIRKMQESTAVALTRSAEKMTELATAETIRLLKKAGYRIEDELQTIRRIVDERMKKYRAQLRRGGSECVERVLTPLGDGTYRATTEVRFVPWINDRSEAEADAILRFIRKETEGGIHPFRIARQLDEVFEGSWHNAETVARTEAQKLRSDARWDVMRDQGVEYFRYITAGDSRVRPEHRMRNGKIYAAKDAPYLGEYNCRCVLVPADRDVKKGAKVTQSEAEIVTE